MEIASSDGVEFYEAYGKFINSEPKPSFIDSYLSSLKQNQGRRVEKSDKLNKWLENAIVAVFVVGCVLVGFVVIAAQIAWLLLALLAVVISAFAISSVFKSE